MIGNNKRTKKWFFYFPCFLIGISLTLVTQVNSETITEKIYKDSSPSSQFVYEKEKKERLEIFKIVYKEDISYTCAAPITEDKGRVVCSDAKGVLEVKNKKNEIIATGNIEIKEGWVAVKGKRGASFKYESQAKKINSKMWIDKEPMGISNISLKENQWTIESDNFFFLLNPSEYLTLLLDESIVRASILTLAEGKYELFGYRIKVMKDGAKVKFLKGVIVETHDCKISEL